MLVPVGEKLVDYNEGFKLYLATRNSRIDLPPDASALLSQVLLLQLQYWSFELSASVLAATGTELLVQVNFHSSRAGLAGQLLSATIAKERPELEVRQSELLQKQEELKLELIQLEESLLVQLANAQGMPARASRAVCVCSLLHSTRTGHSVYVELHARRRQHPGEQGARGVAREDEAVGRDDRVGAGGERAAASSSI